MKIFKCQTDFILVLFFSLLMLADPLAAEAYIDPGTGSFIIQAVIAFIAVTGFYFKFFGRKIRGISRYFLSKDKDDQTKADSIDEHKQQQQK